MAISTGSLTITPVHPALGAEIGEKSTDAYVVDKSRELGFVRPGEGIIALDVPTRPLPAAAVPADRPDRFTRWLQLFFGTR